MKLLFLLLSLCLTTFCLHEGTVCDCPKPAPCPVIKCPIRSCAPSLVFSQQMHSTAARVRRLRNIKQISSDSLPTDTSLLRKVTLAPLKPIIERPFILPKRHAVRVSSIVEDYPTEEELKELDRLPVVKTSQEVHQSLELSTTQSDVKIITSTVPSIEIKPVVFTIPSATIPNKKKRKHRKTTTTTTEEPTTVSTTEKTETAAETEQPFTTTEVTTTEAASTTTRPPPAVTINDSIEIKEDDVQEEQTTASTTIIITTDSTSSATTAKTTPSTSTSMPQTSSPQDLKGLDSIVADVSLPHVKRENNSTNDVPVVSAGYKTNPQFAPEEVNVEDEKCNDEELLKLLIEAMQIDDSNGSKRAIGALLSSGQTKFTTGQVSVMCTQHQMAFRLVARKYCQLTAGSATCIAFML